MWSGSSQQQLHLLVPVSALVILHTVVIKYLTSSNLKEEGCILSYSFRGTFRPTRESTASWVGHQLITLPWQSGDRRTGSGASVYNFNAHPLYPTFSGKALSLKNLIHSLPTPAGNQVSRHVDLSETFHIQTTKWSSWSPPYPYFYLYDEITSHTLHSIMYLYVPYVCVNMFINKLALTYSYYLDRKNNHQCIKTREVEWASWKLRGLEASQRSILMHQG